MRIIDWKRLPLRLISLTSSLEQLDDVSRWINQGNLLVGFRSCSVDNLDPKTNMERVSPGLLQKIQVSSSR